MAPIIFLLICMTALIFRLRNHRDSFTIILTVVIGCLLLFILVTGSYDLYRQYSQNSCSSSQAANASNFDKNRSEILELATSSNPDDVLLVAKGYNENRMLPLNLDWCMSERLSRQAAKMGSGDAAEFSKTISYKHSQEWTDYLSGDAQFPSKPIDWRYYLSPLKSCASNNINNIRLKQAIICYWDKQENGDF